MQLWSGVIVPVWLVLGSIANPEATRAFTATAPADGGPVDTAILLIVDPSAQAELKLTLDQKRVVQRDYQKVDRQIWVMRDWPAEKSAEQIRPLVEGFEKNVRVVLKPGQERRLDEIMLQYRGPEALLRPEVAQALALWDHQNKQVRVVLDDTRKKLEAFGKVPADEKAGRKQYDAARTLKSREQNLLLAILTEEQKQKWVALRGARFDLSQIQASMVRAPELEDADSKDAWVNSEPLSLAKLRGQVVVVHFWTFSCGNCIHNYPWYKAWQTDFSGKGVTIIGIHTPETEGDRNTEKLRQKVKDNGLLFPILIDSHRQNWDAWGNNVWPSVYLVDRQGRVRYWWYGELKWGGRDGEKLMRSRIEELLGEASDGGDGARSKPASLK